jgi:hypothetical protein
VAVPVRSNQPVVIEEGEPPAPAAKALGEVAAAERERRRLAGPPALVIDNKNLARYATGNLTTSERQVAENPPPPPPPNGVAPLQDETYWRERVHGLREQWALAVDAIGELEARAANLRTRFYAQDDPYVRDGEIKPAWDRALDNLRAARERARSFEEQLSIALEEGRAAGALPGWLRDGIELEPAEQPYERPDRKVAHDDGNLVREPEELGQTPHR